MENKILTELKTRKYGSKTIVDWKNIIPMDIEVIYNDTYYKISITDKKGDYLFLKWKDNSCKLDSTLFLKRVGIGNLVGVKTTRYTYKINQEVKTKTGIVKILKQIKMIDNGGNKRRGYLVECLKDGYKYEVNEINLENGTSCPLCINKVAVKGINDVATTHPHLVKYFVNIEDAYTHTYGSEDNILTICPYCGEIRDDVSVKSLTKYNYKCPRCGNNTPFTERIMFSLLKYLVSNDFEREFNPKWNGLGLKRYDFYVPKYNLIIEMHGRQHYDDKCFERMNKKDFQYEVENDKLKKQIAIYNGIKKENYIVIDCRESDFDFIKGNIVKSRLNDLFNLSSVDWNIIKNNSIKNRLSQIVDLWNDGKTVRYIKEYFKTSSNPILEDLKLANELGLCDYSIDKSRSRSSKESSLKHRAKQIEIFKNGISLGIFESAKDLERQSLELFGTKLSNGNISVVCNGKRDNYKGYTFAYTKNRNKLI